MGGYDTGTGAIFGVNSAFVAAERYGHWGKVEQVPGLAALNHGQPNLYSISCASPGNCAAAGSYAVRSGHSQAFVVSEKNGTWGKAIRVPGSGALFGGRNSEVRAVSCASAGNCAGGGGSKDSSFRPQAFVVSERGGKWGKAAQVPGSSALNTGGSATIYAVSCAPRGKCAAAGVYTDSKGKTQGFVVSQN